MAALGGVLTVFGIGGADRFLIEAGDTVWDFCETLVATFVNKQSPAGRYHPEIASAKVSYTNAWLDYQVFSDRAQNYTANLRVSTGEGTAITLKSGEQTLATFTGTARGWQTISAPVALPAGKSTFRLISNGPARLNWLEFSAK